MLAVAFSVTAVSAEKEAPPAGGEPKDFELPTIETLELENGLQAKLVPFGYIPKVQVRVVVRTGTIDEQPDEVWLGDLLGMMIEEGAGDRNAEQLAEAFAALGGGLGVGFGLESVWLLSDGLSEFAPDLIQLLGDVTRRPTLPASELERRQGDLVRRLAVRKTQPGSIAEQKFWSVLYGGDHPFGRPLPEAEQISAYTLGQLRDFHSDNFGAKRTSIYVVGVFDLEATKAAIEEAFADWQPGPEPTLNPPQPRQFEGRPIYLVDRPGAAQSTLRLGLPVIDPSHPDSLPLLVTNTLLGGSFSSRITANLREDKGYTYSPISSVRTTRRKAAAWIQSADVTTAVTGPAIREVLYEIDRLRAEAPSAEELEGIQNYLAGAYVRRNSNPSGIAYMMYSIDFHGLGDDYLTSYVQKIFAVTPEDVRRMTETYLDPDSMALIVVGDTAAISNQLEGLGTPAE